MANFDKLAALTNRAVERAFGELVTYTPDGGQAVPLRAVFDEAYASVSLSQGVPVTSTAPALTVELWRLAAVPAQGDTYTRANGQAFEVAEVQAEGRGTVKLISLKV